jgi:hypothetical protein
MKQGARASAGICVIAAAALLSCTTSSAPTWSSASNPIGGPSPNESAAALSCPAVSETKTSGHIESTEVAEVSGIVSSTRNEDVFWVHNDSGDSARAFAVSSRGKLMATLSFDTASAIDIEDMAIEDAGNGESFLYFGDIGDNATARPSVTIHRVAEPKLAPPELASAPHLTAVSEKMQVSYAEGPRDAETLLFDPLTRDLLIVTKKLFGRTEIHRVGPFAAGTTVHAEKIGSVAISFATGGDISRDGRLIAIRNYGTSASLWTRAPGESLAGALSREPCQIPVAEEPQGEAFGFLAHGSGYVTAAEGKAPELHVTVFK